jgi:hypothetical protein
VKSAVVHHYYANPSLLPAAGRGGGRRQLGGRVGAGTAPCRRARDARASLGRAEIDHQVLGEAGHREPNQGGICCGAVQHVRRRNPAKLDPREDSASRSPRARVYARARGPAKRCQRWGPRAGKSSTSRPRASEACRRGGWGPAR